jgi:hypothetical protein
MMKFIQIDATEDDLTAFIQHLLAARIQFLGWSVGDQSKGGFSASGKAPMPRPTSSGYDLHKWCGVPYNAQSNA